MGTLPWRQGAGPGLKTGLSWSQSQTWTWTRLHHMRFSTNLQDFIHFLHSSLVSSSCFLLTFPCLSVSSSFCLFRSVLPSFSASFPSFLYFHGLALFPCLLLSLSPLLWASLSHLIFLPFASFLSSFPVFPFLYFTYSILLFSSVLVLVSHFHFASLFPSFITCFVPCSLLPS